ncbi:MAG: hypothetical protein Q9191_000245 [Dirinaria sp. TL-2023a]
MFTPIYFALATLSFTFLSPLASAAPQDFGLSSIEGRIFSQHAASVASNSTRSLLHPSSTIPHQSPIIPASTSTRSNARPSSTVPAPSSTGTVTVHVGNTPQSVGDLTGIDFVKKIKSAVTPLCPDVANGKPGSCTGDNAIIDDIAHIDEQGNLGGGSLTFNVRDSNYNSNDERDGMVGIFANTMKTAASGSANCKATRYKSGCQNAKMMARSPLLPDGPNVPNADCTHGTMNICSGPDNVYIELPDSSVYMNIDVTFTWPGEAFSCLSVLDTIEEALAVLPELEIISKSVEVGVAIAKPCCESEGCGKTGGDKRWLLD